MNKAQIKRIAYDIISHLIDDALCINPYICDDDGNYLYSLDDVEKINKYLATLAQKFWEKGNPGKDED